MPVKFLIFPSLAFLYKPLGSLFSAIDRGTSINTSLNSFSSNMFRIIFLSAINGEINAVITTKPASTINLATSPIRLIFSILSASVNPRSLFNPCLILSPSKIKDLIPLS